MGPGRARTAGASSARPRVSGVSPGQETAVDETSAPRAQGETEHQRGDRDPEVTTDLLADVATLTVGG